MIEITKSAFFAGRSAFLCAAFLLLGGGCCPRPLILPESALRANIVIINPPPPPVLRRGEKQRVDVKVKNLSAADWQTRGSDSNWLTRGETGGKYRVNVGNHWLDENGKIVVNDDGRAPLPDVVKAGETIDISLDVKAPKDPGDYELEIDLVQENVAWFGQKGSQTARSKIKVE